MIVIVIVVVVVIVMVVVIEVRFILIFLLIIGIVRVLECLVVYHLLLRIRDTCRYHINL